LDRIRKACLEAHASKDFPGFLVVTHHAGGDSYPDTLVVWRPTSVVPSNRSTPLWNELVIFTPDPDAPHRLLEVTTPFDSNAAPAPANQSAWRSEIESLLQPTSTNAKKTQLTDLIRTARTGAKTDRAAVRFHVTHRPSASELSSGQPWNSLPWAQSIGGSHLGLRQSSCCMELQLISGEESRNLDPDGATALTFFGSAAIYYGMTPPP
jgi:hypothetical protein